MPKHRDIKRRYRATAIYDLLMKYQKGLCAICKQPERVLNKRTQRPRRLYIDHNHKTNEIRGLLCQRCNLGIGHLQEDLAILESAIAYLKTFN